MKHSEIEWFFSLVVHSKRNCGIDTSTVNNLLQPPAPLDSRQPPAATTSASSSSVVDDVAVIGDETSNDMIQRDYGDQQVDRRCMSDIIYDLTNDSSDSAEDQDLEEEEIPLKSSRVNNNSNSTQRNDGKNNLTNSNCHTSNNNNSNYQNQHNEWEDDPTAEDSIIDLTANGGNVGTGSSTSRFQKVFASQEENEADLMSAALLQSTPTTSTTRTEHLQDSRRNISSPASAVTKPSGGVADEPIYVASSQEDEELQRALEMRCFIIMCWSFSNS